MAVRGQITDAILDGRLAFDNAFSKDAAVTKGINLAVTGNFDFSPSHNHKTGNILAKRLGFHEKADSAGMVLGAKVSVALSRADSLHSKIAGCVVATLAHSLHIPNGNGR